MFREYFKGRFVCVYFSFSEGSDGNRRLGVFFVERFRGEIVGEQRCDKGKGFLKQFFCFKGVGFEERGEDFSGVVVSFLQQDGYRKFVQRYYLVFKVKGVFQKRYFQEFRGGRCFLVGFSRFGSVKGEVGYVGQNFFFYRLLRNKVIQDKFVGGIYFDSLQSVEVLRLGVRKSGIFILFEDVQIFKEIDLVVGFFFGQSVNMDFFFMELRLQIIQRERSRKELFRRKNKVVVVIQRVWRRQEDGRRSFFVVMVVLIFLCFRMFFSEFFVLA